MHCPYRFCHCPDEPIGYGFHHSCADAQEKMNAIQRVHCLTLHDDEFVTGVKAMRHIRLSYVAGRKSDSWMWSK